MESGGTNGRVSSRTDETVASDDGIPVPVDVEDVAETAEGDSDTEEAEEEPIFDYFPIRGKLQQYLSHDSASCVALHPQSLVRVPHVFAPWISRARATSLLWFLLVTNGRLWDLNRVRLSLRTGLERSGNAPGDTEDPCAALISIRCERTTLCFLPVYLRPHVHTVPRSRM